MVSCLTRAAPGLDHGVDELEDGAPAVRIRGPATILTTAYAIDVVPKLEAFRVHVTLEEVSGEDDPRFKPVQYETAGEVLFSVFQGRSQNDGGTTKIRCA